MKRWTGTVVVRYYQEITVEAETEVEAEGEMCDAFDPSKVTYTSECEVFDVQEVSDENI